MLTLPWETHSRGLPMGTKHSQWCALASWIWGGIVRCQQRLCPFPGKEWGIETLTGGLWECTEEPTTGCLTWQRAFDSHKKGTTIKQHISFSCKSSTLCSMALKKPNSAELVKKEAGQGDKEQNIISPISCLSSSHELSLTLNWGVWSFDVGLGWTF